MCLPQRVHITGESLCNKSVICCSVTQLCLTLCDPMDFSTQGFPVLYHILEYCSSSCPSSPCCHPTISSSVVPFSSCPQSFTALGSFPMSWLFISGGQSIGASASILPRLISFRIDWFDLLAVLGLSGVFSNTIIQKHQFFGVQLSSESNSHINGHNFYQKKIHSYILCLLLNI